jgi:hypothetical protein
MKKYLFLIFVLLASPTISWADNNTIKEFTNKIEHGSNQGVSNIGKDMENAFESFKDDPIGQTKHWFIEAKDYFFYLLGLVQNAWEELKKKFA